MPVGVS